MIAGSLQRNPCPNVHDPPAALGGISILVDTAGDDRYRGATLALDTGDTAMKAGVTLAVVTAALVMQVMGEMG